jgi:hypothetical protein
MTKIDIRYREVLLPALTDITRPGGLIDLNAAEELLGAHGLRDLARAQRVATSILNGWRR